jgi:TonB family protein
MKRLAGLLTVWIAATGCGAPESAPEHHSPAVLEAPRQARKVVSPAPVEAPLQIGGDVKAPVLMKRVDPDYPPGAKYSSRGIIVLEGVVTRTGRMRDLRILKGAGDPMVPYILTAVRQWEFRPATKNGKPVDVIYHLSTRVEVR